MMSKKNSKVGHVPAGERGLQKNERVRSGTRGRAVSLLLEGLYDAYGKWEHTQPHETESLYRTIRWAYRFVVYLDEHRINPSTCSVSEAAEYLSELTEAVNAQGRTKYRTGTVLNFFKGARSFCDFLVDRGIRMHNPVRALTPPKEARRIPKDVPDEQEMASYLDGLSRFDDPVYRSAGEIVNRYIAHVISEVQYDTGLRIGEVASLHEEDLDYERGVIRLRRGKGGRPRIAIMGERVMRILALYQQVVRPVLFAWDDRYDAMKLFGRSSKDLAAQVRCGLSTSPSVPRSVTTHLFRHAFGYHLLRAGCPLRSIQELLGHQALRSTEVYTKVDETSLMKTVDAAHPRQWRNKS